MREILFRGKTVNGEWKYGDYVRFKDGNTTKHYIYGEGEVIPETVGQYTGLTDLNGTKIFEGDILQFFLDDDEKHYITVVFEECAFLVEDKGITECDLLPSYTCLGIEVVGNIHANPDC